MCLFILPCNSLQVCLAEYYRCQRRLSLIQDLALHCWKAHQKCACLLLTFLGIVLWRVHHAWIRTSSCLFASFHLSTPILSHLQYNTQFHISLVQMLDLPFTYHLPIYLKNCKAFTFSLYSIVSLYSFLLFFIFNVENDSNNAFILFLASKKFPFASQKWLLQNLHIHRRFSNYYLAKPDAANHLQVAKLSLACAKQL